MIKNMNKDKETDKDIIKDVDKDIIKDADKETIKETDKVIFKDADKETTKDIDKDEDKKTIKDIDIVNEITKDSTKSISISKYHAVVFDMDGVIFDSEAAVMNCWLKLADKYGIKNIMKPYMACIGTTVARTREIMLSEYGNSFPYDEYAKETSIMYHEKYDGGRLPMKKGVVELLEFLKNEGKKIALASSTRRQTVMNQLKDADILKYFDAVICGDMVERSKPAPDIFLKACEAIDELPACTYAIEDSYNGIRAAHTGGLRPIMVPDLLHADEEMEKLAEIILTDLIKVKEYLNGK